jgi:DnaD/phage-associated family protein
MPFNGFPAGKVRMTPIPAQFFAELLPEIDHLGELKVSLYAFWFLDRQEGDFRYLTAQDLREDQIFMAGMGPSEEAARSALEDALERAVIRGTLIKLQPAEGEALYFLNSPRGRAAVEALRAGAWSPSEVARPEIRLDGERPNIFRLYEQNIGPLTPMIAEALRDAESTYPLEWIESAIRAAVEANVRKWRYVEAILKARLERGDDGTDRAKFEKDRQRYVKGEYGDLIEH